MKSVRPFLVRVVLILSLSAPGAAKFENPLALSYNDSSSFAETNSSLMKSPTRYEGLFVYGSRTNLSADTFTKCPRMKKTPSAIETIHPTPEAPISIKFATVSPELI